MSEVRRSAFRLLLVALAVTSLLLPLLARPASDRHVLLTASSTLAAPAQGSADAERATTAAIAAALGPCNRGEPRIWFAEYKAGTYQIRFNINDGGFDGITRTGARKDVLDIVRTVKATGLPVKRLAVVGAFPMTDVYGNTGNIVVLSLIYSAQTLARMNPDGISWVGTNDLFAIADQHQVAPAFISQ